MTRTYPTWERAHDTKLVADLKDARFVEARNGDELFITYAHLSGRVWFCDGTMYWRVDSQTGGEKRVDQSDIDGSGDYLLNYGRKAVRNNLRRIADEVIASAEKRLARG